MVQCPYTQEGFELTLESIRFLQNNSTENSQFNSNTICDKYIEVYTATANRWEHDKQKFNYDQLVVLCSLMKKARESAPDDQADDIDTDQIFRFLQKCSNIELNNTDNSQIDEYADSRTILNFNMPIEEVC